MSVSTDESGMTLVFEGDFGVGLLDDPNDYSMHLVQIPKGSPGRNLTDEEGEICLNNIPTLSMIFKDVKSIDVLLEGLQIIKEKMISTCR